MIAPYRFHYHFFIVWSNGFYAINEILEIIRRDENLEIITIKKRQVKNIRKFVFNLYACDTVPIHHLKLKLQYLYDLPQEYISVFAKNYNPQDEISGKGNFRKTQDKYIVKVKNHIRNLYNPRHEDPSFHIFPLDKGVSHEHVIHASDSEDQVDYFLKLLGHKQGIKYLDNENCLLFEKPYHIKKTDNYTFRQVPIKNLFASIHTSNNRKADKKIKDTPQFLGLTDARVYESYLLNYQFSKLCDDYSLEKLLTMKTIDKAKIRQLPPIIVKPTGEYFIILDGVHRAAITLYNNFERIHCVVLNE